MEFSAVVERYGEETMKDAMIRLTSRIEQIIRHRTDSAVNGMLMITMEEIQEDAHKVACVLDEFPFSLDEKFAVIEKAWEIIGL